MAPGAILLSSTTRHAGTGQKPRNNLSYNKFFFPEKAPPGGGNRCPALNFAFPVYPDGEFPAVAAFTPGISCTQAYGCLLYTSDAADE